ncbi:phospholipase [Sporosarcina sp. Marseille-Q4063]|uniref:phospholipase D-like domain-containing protein n=1 Tax=Sporosarcina sp. Marseille-Q4063 TaxID=2810514 RepID=UPI001BB09EBC|nr:phospholipase D-like domain-containing protein [Sporosarcina sp. Marseille-Q4063]QUW21083.1 phospholipase [Sporosarcina sp. Marseille-Q4063]
MKSKKKKIIIGSVGILLLIYIATILWHTFKPLPTGLSYEGKLHYTDDVQMITDLTYAQNEDGDDLRHEIHIFDEVNQLIEDAEQFIVLDFFLFDHYSDENIAFPKNVETMTENLVKKKEINPKMPITFITDPLNIGYGSYENKWFEQMEDAGIKVVYTDLDPLRDSTPIYSGLYRTIFRWMDVKGKGWIPNAMSCEAPKMTLASYVTLLNIKANHRKAIVTEKEAIVTSGNPHNASGFHGNVAMKVTGPVINDILEAEEAVVNYTNGGTLPRANIEEKEDGEYQVQYITEKKILDTMLVDINKAQKGDQIFLGMFFIAEESLVKALLDAASRGVDVKMILDPNKNSFGSQKTGLPNRPVAQRMKRDSKGKIDIRWYNTVIGQYHTKLVVVQTADETYISNGAANLTDRALNNYNLESNLRIIAPNDSELVQDINTYFERLWKNEDALYTVDFEKYQNDFTFYQRSIIRLQKLFKLTTY